MRLTENTHKDGNKNNKEEKKEQRGASREKLKKALFEIRGITKAEKRLEKIVAGRRTITERAEIKEDVEALESAKIEEDNARADLEKIRDDKSRAEAELRNAIAGLKKKYTETETETAGRIKGMDVLVYDASTYGDLVTFDGLQGYKEVERHWINEPYAFVSILYNENTHQYLYFISEPVLTAFEKELLVRIYNNLRDALMHMEIEFESMDKEAILYDEYNKILDLYGIILEPQSLYKIWYYLKRNYIGYGKLDVLMRDPGIEDISCDGVGVPIFLYHRDYLNVEVNMKFNEEVLNNIVIQLAQLGGKSISSGFPIVNARLPDGSRLEATLGREISTHGSSFTIRKFREEPFTPPDLIRYGTFSSVVMAYLWLAVENNKSMIFVGGTASGKTTSLNAVSLFIPPVSKIITIEDTRELTLFHQNWIAEVVREAYVGQEAASIDMFELLRAALRQRPEYIIVGEVRGTEAFTLFQAMSTGHTTYSTMHAGTVQAAVNRLLSDPINVPLMMLHSLDVMSVQIQTYIGRKRVRRIERLVEFVGIDPATGDISIKELYVWNPSLDIIEEMGGSKVLDDIMSLRGWSKDTMNKELENRKRILEYMVDKNITNYKEVSKIVQAYSIDPEGVMSSIEGV
jgi:flagellar protein FlaI